MSAIPTQNSSSEYHITSVAYKQYLGDDQAGGVLPPYPIVVLHPDILPPKFTVTKGNEVNTYTIKVNGNMVHDKDNRVVSYNDGCTTEWVIIFRRHERAYTVQRKVESCLAWTAPMLEPNRPTNPLQILLEPLFVRPSNPPQFNPAQLFKFEFVKA
ncbi:hypothetical protein BKA82DRAFT_1001299 [Pisolithus tinctorius]|uniref:Uncharacterized protein n=1 Tax=Pisolithus tinctorius Marx 270 TaxID=870435 RepID=A0A0C3J2W0_PISTI|nr:hypothetical protein BKA82DRAFT_1001299 [Pisolithus tinctorius]KIO03388.1 hypothetical protein M404DRAFT_1001299 [Pisolithus tinctorius Marx 270]